MKLSCRFSGTAAALVLAVVVSSCAEMAPPPGGPADVVAPALVSVTPESLGTGVDPAAPLVLTFSEKVSKGLLSDWLFIRPFRRIDEINWNGPVATITFRGGFPPDSTISIVIGDGIADRHGNRLLKPFRRTFSTGATVDPGRIEGYIRRTRAAAAAAPAMLPGTSPAGSTQPPPTAPQNPTLPATATGTGPAAAVFVWMYRVTTDTLPDLARVDPDYLGLAGADGSFTVDGLPLGTPLRIVAVFDSDRSRTFSPGRDYAAAHPDTIVLTSERPQLSGFNLLLIDPKAPGVVGGRLLALADTSVVDTLSYGVLVSSYPEEPDSVQASWPPARAERQGLVTKSGTFSIRGITAGRYRAAVFRDVDKNGQWTRTEPLGEPEIVTVRPDDETRVELRRPPPP